MDRDGSGEITDQILNGLTDFVDSFVVPLEEKNAQLLNDQRLTYDERGAKSAPVKALLRQVRMKSAEAGYYTMFVPEEAGGGGLGYELLYRCYERLYHRYGPGRILPYASISQWSYGPSILNKYLTPEVASTVHIPLMSGEQTCCFAMSEPDAGSDAWAMRTNAVATENGWRINGVKQWTTNSPTADLVYVFAVTDPELKNAKKGGVSCFILPTSTPGFAVDSVIRLFGHLGGDEGILSFNDVEVPRTALVGTLHKGFQLAMAGVSTGRIYNAGRCVGLARWALDQAREYAAVRKTFGRPIGDYQGISFQIADSAVEIHAADLIALDCARKLDAGDRATDEVAMVKLYSTEMCSRVYDRCMQIHGGMGITNETKLYDGWHTARIVRIADGSAEIMRRNIAKSLIG